MCNMCDKKGRRVADQESVSDVVRENEVLKIENIGLRQRAKALNETVESLKSRNTQLVTDNEKLLLVQRANTTGPILAMHFE